MKSVERSWDWWAYHYRVVHRSQIPGINQWDDDLVEMIVDVLALRPGDRILDLACGNGEHSRRLARRGLDVVGVDIAPSLVTHCQTMTAEEGLATPQFEVGDMRGLAYDEEFDAVVLISGSYGKGYNEQKKVREPGSPYLSRRRRYPSHCGPAQRGRNGGGTGARNH